MTSKPQQQSLNADSLKKVIEKLTEKTLSGGVDWDDSSSSLVGRDVFRARFGEVFVQVSEGFNRVVDDEGEERFQKHHKFEIFNMNGFTVAESKADSSDTLPESDIERLFKAALAVAREQGGVLEQLLVELGR
jgi:hypothetical protein